MHIINITRKGNKYFDLYDKNNKKYRLFFRTSKNPDGSFFIDLIQEVSPTKSFSYKKSFVLDEFNKYVQNYKQYEDVNTIQNELLENIMNPNNIQIKYIDESSLQINILLNNTFQLAFKIFKNHEIYELNEEIVKTKEQIFQTNNIKSKFDSLSNELQNCDGINKNNDIKLQKLKDMTTKLFNMFNNRSQMPNQNFPSEEIMLTKTKEERYRILGIKSDIVHSLNELFHISRWLSSEKVTKLKLLFKGPYENFNVVKFHALYDNMVPSLILIESTNGARFGGFTNDTWKGENLEKYDNTAFLFSLNYLEKYPVNPKYAKAAINASTRKFCHFGKNDLVIFGNCHQMYSKSEFPEYYMCQKNGVNPKNRLSLYSPDFIVKDLEIFQVYFTMRNI